MPDNPLNKLVNPRLPPAAIGLEAKEASAVLLDRRRGGYSIKRAATISLPEGLLQPSFDEINITDINEMAATLSQLVTSAGLQRQRKWSVALPEASTRAVIITLESTPSGRGELDEILRWKMERVFGAPVEELRVAHERLPSDAQGRARYAAVAVRLAVLAEYETVFSVLGWRAGLVLPRHVGEMQWLEQNGARAQGDSLLVSSHAEGFTAVVVRGRQPIVVRAVVCEAEDRDDELYRLLLFYRDRLASPEESNLSYGIERLLALGNGLTSEHVGEIVNETLGVHLRSMEASDLGLTLPSADLSFDSIAAPAGLATLAWR